MSLLEFKQNLRLFSNWLAALAAYLIVRLLFLTLRIERFGLQNKRKAIDYAYPKGFGLAIWHENFPASLRCGFGEPYTALVSLSSDGTYVSWLMRWFGYKPPVRGSSSRGGEAARISMQESVTEGNYMVVTVDGPRGPRRVVKAGILDLSRKAQVMILPMACVASRFWQLKSWDCCKIPKPFSTVYQIFGEPFVVPADVDAKEFSEFQARLAMELNQLEELRLK